MAYFDHDTPQDDNQDYPYSSYYTTGGGYRPPKKPRRHGWLVATIGVLLLCVAGWIVAARLLAPAKQEETAAAESFVSQAQTGKQETAGATDGTLDAAVAGTEEGAGDHVDDGTDDGTADQSASGSAVMLFKKHGSQELTLQEVYEKVIPSVVSITVTGRDGTSYGTGIVLNKDGYIITNYHVVENGESISVLVTAGQEYYGQVIGIDEVCDLAVLRIDATNLTAAEFGDSDDVEVGDAVVAIGDPLGAEFRGTMTNGIISAINRDVQIDGKTMSLIQTNAAINEGNSGGPLINMYGQVIGITTMKMTSGYSTVEGLGFAIPTTTAQPVIDELASRGYVAGRAALGFDGRTLPSSISTYYHLPQGVYVTEVDARSDACAQGILKGDIITSANDTIIATWDDLNTVKNQLEAGDTLTLIVFRQEDYGQEVQLKIDVVLMDQAELE